MHIFRMCVVPMMRKAEWKKSVLSFQQKVGRLVIVYFPWKAHNFILILKNSVSYKLYNLFLYNRVFYSKREAEPLTMMCIVEHDAASQMLSAAAPSAKALNFID